MLGLVAFRSAWAVGPSPSAAATPQRAAVNMIATPMSMCSIGDEESAPKAWIAATPTMTRRNSILTMNAGLEAEKTRLEGIVKRGYDPAASRKLQEIEAQLKGGPAPPPPSAPGQSPQQGGGLLLSRWATEDPHPRALRSRSS